MTNTNFDSSSFATAFWKQYDALVERRADFCVLDYLPDLFQAAAILVLANVLDNRQEGD